MITLTETAASRVKSLLAEKNPDVALRIFIKSGGCSGFSYGMGLDQAHDNDNVFQENGVTVLVDPASLQYLDGAKVDYVDSLMGAGFKVENPNAASSCGCGSSFRTKSESGNPGSCGC